MRIKNEVMGIDDEVQLIDWSHGNEEQMIKEWSHGNEDKEWSNGNGEQRMRYIYMQLMKKECGIKVWK